MTSLTRKKRSFVLLASAAGLLLIAVVRRLQAPVLLDRAHKVANVSSWWSAETSIDAQFMMWTTDTQLFAMGDAKEDTTAIDPIESSKLPFLYDTRNQNRTDLTKLAEQLSAGNASNAGFDLAPDGKHIAWIPSSGDRVVVSQLDGSNRQTWHASNATEVIWDRDSKHWRALCRQGESDDATVTTASIEAPGIVTPLQPQEASDRVSRGGLHHELDNEFQVDLVGDQVASTANGMRAQTHTVKLRAPEGTTINDLIVSPDGRFIAWELQSFQRREPFLGSLPWLRRFLGPPSRHRMELWISKADGTDMHEVGYCPLGADPSDDNGPKLILWQPDSKHVSFVYKNFLYVAGNDR